jgi:hypothetical protein
VAVTPTWSTSHGDAGTDSGWEDIAVPIPEFPSLMLQALLTVLLISVVRRRVSRARYDDGLDEDHDEQHDDEQHDDDDRSEVRTDVEHDR